MAITLDSITISETFVWTDEYEWAQLGQSNAHTLTGALIVETGTKLAGRPITLSEAWATKAEIEILRTKLALDEEMTLTLHDAREFTVRFDHSGPGITAQSIFLLAAPESTDHYALTLKFIEV